MFLSKLGYSELVQRLFEKMTFFLGLPLSQIWKGGRGLIHCGKEAFNADVALDPPVDSRPSPPSTS